LLEPIAAPRKSNTFDTGMNFWLDGHTFPDIGLSSAVPKALVDLRVSARS